MKKANKIILTLIIILLLSVIAVGGYFFVKNDKTSNDKIGELENKVKELDDKNATLAKKENDYDKIKGTYTKKVKPETTDETTYESAYTLYLNNDGTFEYHWVPGVGSVRNIGYYTVKGDKITLNCILGYGSDPSVTVVDEKYELTILDNGAIVENEYAKGNLEKTSSDCSEKINIADEIKKVAKTEYFFVEK